MSAPDLAIVVPAHNEAPRIAALLERIPDELPGIGAITTIVVDDGSRDDTGAVARAAGATVVRHRVNLGKGGALRTGCEAALRLDADLIVAMDADGQHHPEQLPSLLRPLLDGSADIVLGAREFGGEMPTLFRVGNRVLNVAVRVLFGIKVRDTQCGYRAFRASAYSHIRWTARDYAVESEMLVRMARAGLRWTEVPVTTAYADRFKGTQPSDGLKILRQLLLWRIAP